MPTPPAPAWTRMRLALAHARHVFQRMPGGHEDHRQRRGFFKGKPAGNVPHIAAARQRVRGKAEDREAEDAIARRDDASTPCADRA